MPDVKPGAGVALKICGWLWCAIMAILAISLFVTGSVLAGIAYGASAFLAAPPSWRVLARYGIQATRKTKAVAVFGASILGGLTLATTGPPTSNKTVSKASVAEPPSGLPSTEGPSTCEGIKSTPRDFAVLKDAPLHERADARSGQVSVPFGVDQVVSPVSIDTTMPVREMCRFGEWSYVAILQLPSDIGNGKGWVPTANLRPVATNEKGRRVFGVHDLRWPEGSKPYQKAVLTVVNRIGSQNPKCDAVNDQSLLFQPDREGAKFHIVCFGEQEQSIDFRPADAANGRSFAPVAATTREDAMRLCEAAARERISHPSTADFSIWGARFSPYEDGTSVYKTTFTAKNSFNLELSFRVECGFLGSDLTSVDIFEAEQ